MKKITDWVSKKRHPIKSMPVPVDLQTALGALLVRMAKCDQHYHPLEIDQIESILSKAYELDQNECARLRSECERYESALDETEDFAIILRDRMDYEDRLTIVDAAWTVLMADHMVRLPEQKTLETIEKTLNISHADSYVLRHRHR